MPKLSELVRGAEYKAEPNAAQVPLAGLLDDINAARLRQAQGAMSHRKFDPVTGRQIADAMQSAGLLASPVPVVGDVAGLLGDAAMYATKPEERTWGNAAMTALGVLPFMPSLAGKLGRAGRVLDVTDSNVYAEVRKAMGGNKIPEGQIRQAVAQYNAALPKQAGGLGLQPNNNAMQRATDLGFDTRPSQSEFHGARGEISGPVDPKRSDFGFHTGTLEQADNRLRQYADTTNSIFGESSIYPDGANIIPLLRRRDARFLPVEDLGSFSSHVMLPQLEEKGLISKKAVDQALRKQADEAWRDLSIRQRQDAISRQVLRDKGYDGVVYENVQEGVGKSQAYANPSVIRSRFAAFDPAQRNSRNLLASLAGVGLLSPAFIASMRDEDQ